MNDFWNPMNKDNVYDFLEEIGVCEKDEIKNANIDELIKESNENWNLAMGEQVQLAMDYVANAMRYEMKLKNWVEE